MWKIFQDGGSLKWERDIEFGTKKGKVWEQSSSEQNQGHARTKVRTDEVSEALTCAQNQRG